MSEAGPLPHEGAEPGPPLWPVGCLLCFVSLPDCGKGPSFSSESEKIKPPSAAPLTVPAQEPRPLAPLRVPRNSAWAPGAGATQKKAARGFPLSVFCPRGRQGRRNTHGTGSPHHVFPRTPSDPSGHLPEPACTQGLSFCSSRKQNLQYLRLSSESGLSGSEKRS